MRTRFNPALFVMFLVGISILLPSCRRRGKETPSEAVFRVNGLEADSRVDITPEAQTVSVDVYLSAGEWSWYVVGNLPDWLQVLEEQGVGEVRGCIVLQVQALEEQMPRSAVLVFQAGATIRKVSLKQSPPDPFQTLTVPGAYGVKGGDAVFDPSHCQKSLLSHPNGFSFRILYPAVPRAAILSFPKKNLQAGDIIDVRYRVVERGFTLVSEVYTGAEVTRVADNMAWIRQDDNTCFIVPVPAL